LLLEEVKVHLVVILAYYDVSSGQLLDKESPLVEILDQDLKSLEANLIGAFIVENKPHQVDVKRNLAVDELFVSFPQVIVANFRFFRFLERNFSRRFFTLSHFFLKQFVRHLEFVVKLMDVEQVLELNLEVDGPVAGYVRE